MSKIKEIEDINFFKRGGNYPYQAEGVINNKDYFYFRARHNRVSLELYSSRKELDNMDNVGPIINIKNNSVLNDDEALKLIKQLYKTIKNYV